MNQCYYSLNLISLLRLTGHKLSGSRNACVTHTHTLTTESRIKIILQKEGGRVVGTSYQNLFHQHVIF